MQKTDISLSKNKLRSHASSKHEWLFQLLPNMLPLFFHVPELSRFDPPLKISLYLPAKQAMFKNEDKTK